MSIYKSSNHKSSLLSPYFKINPINQQQTIISNSLIVEPNDKSYTNKHNQSSVHIFNNDKKDKTKNKSILFNTKTNTKSQTPNKNNSKLGKLQTQKQKNQQNITNQLQMFREKLTKKLHTHILIYNVDNMNKCLKHDCYLSAYDKFTQKLLCAACFTETITPINSISQIKYNPENSQKSKKIKRQVLPLQKSIPFIQSDLIQMKAQLLTQISTLKKIEDILYEGFNEQHKQLNSSLKNIQDKFQQVINQLRTSYKTISNKIMQKYTDERIKHEKVLKQLTTLRLLAEQFIIQKKQKNIQPILHNNQIYLKNYLKQNKQLTTYEINETLPWSNYPIFPTSLTPLQSQSLLPPNKNIKYTRQSIFFHMILKQLCQSLKFNKSGLIWNKQKHQNQVKKLSQNINKNVDEVIIKIKKLLLSKSNQKTKQSKQF